MALPTSLPLSTTPMMIARARLWVRLRWQRFRRRPYPPHCRTLGRLKGRAQSLAPCRSYLLLDPQPTQVEWRRSWRRPPLGRLLVPTLTPPLGVPVKPLNNKRAFSLLLGGLFLVGRLQPLLLQLIEWSGRALHEKQLKDTVHALVFRTTIEGHLYTI